MATEVQYHSEQGGEARPAINVKVRAPGDAFHPQYARTLSADGTAFSALPGGRSDALVEQAYNRVQSDFWQAAAEIAEQRGLGPIEQGGRSGGWLVFADGGPYIDADGETWLAHPGAGGSDNTDDLSALQEWLAAYEAMREWADAYIADAPRKVRELAQQLAMDEAGEPAARRMFAYNGSVPFGPVGYGWHDRDRRARIAYGVAVGLI